MIKRSNLKGILGYLCMSTATFLFGIGGLESSAKAQAPNDSSIERASLTDVENRLSSLEGKIEVFEPTIKWAFGSAIGLYALVIGLNFFKSLVLDKQERKQIELGLKESLEALLKEDVVPTTIESLKNELEKDILRLQTDMMAVKSELRLLAYRTTMLSADLAANTSIYQYPLALHEYINAIEVLCQELNSMPVSNSSGRTEISIVVAYSVERLAQLALQLKALIKEEKTKDFAPRLSEEQVIEITQALNRLGIENFGSERRKELTILIKSLSD